MTVPVTRVPLQPLDPSRLEPLVGAERTTALAGAAAATRERLGGRRVVNISSTATGGGVAEMLYTLLGYALGMGIGAEWLVIRGDPEFFAITKRIHNGLYGSPGDGGELGDTEHAAYERTLAANRAGIVEAVSPGDVVIVHDPQPAGLIAPLREAGARVVWRCHVGFDGENEWTRRAWAFLRRYVEPAEGHVFSREPFAPPWVDRARLRVIPPSIDPFTQKNVDLPPAAVTAMLGSAGLVETDARHPRVTRPAHVVREGGRLPLDAPLLVQVSRWDRMKDMTGVLEAFVAHVPLDGARLVLAGPSVAGVTDDPEGQEVLEETTARWRALDPADRARVQLVTLPMDDPAENALVVNALQRHAAVVAQKSLAEGFGLTVAEAMWKGRPVVASAVGGIVDQVVEGETGLLVADPHDLEGFGAAVARLLTDPEESSRLGAGGRRRATERFLADRHLRQYAELIVELL